MNISSLQYSTNLCRCRAWFLTARKLSSATDNAAANIQPVSLAFNPYLINANKIERTNPLVIVHGLFGQKQNWRSIAKALQLKLENSVFAVDMRNHGESTHSSVHTYQTMATDLEKFIQEEVLSKSRFKTVFLLGHSMGGKVVAELAQKSQQALEKLIIVDVAPHRSSNSQMFLNYIQAMKRVDLNSSRAEIGRQLRPAIEDDNVRTFLLTNLYKPRGGPFHWRCNLDALEANLDHILTHCIDGNIPVNVPTLFVSGQRSTYLIQNDQYALKRIFPAAIFDEISDAGHWVHSEKPEMFMQSVLRFLKSGYFTYDS